MTTSTLVASLAALAAMILTLYLAVKSLDSDRKVRQRARRSEESAELRVIGTTAGTGKFVAQTAGQEILVLMTTGEARRAKPIPAKHFFDVIESTTPVSHGEQRAKRD